MNPRTAFADALLARRIAARFIEKMGMEHATPEAREKYLKAHPKAEPSDHTVKKPEKDAKPEEDEKGEKGEKGEDEKGGGPKPTEKAEKAFKRFHNDAVYGQGSPTYFLNRLVEEAGSAEDALKAVQHALKDPSLNRGSYGSKERKVYERAEEELLKRTSESKGKGEAKKPRKKGKPKTHQLPKGPKIRVYDNGGETADRYTVIIDGKDWDASANPGNKMSLGLSAGGRGFSEFGEAKEGNHLGGPVDFEDLDEDTRKHIQERLKDEEPEEAVAEKKPAKKRVKAVRDVMEKRKLKDEDADEVEAFVKRKPPKGQKLSDFQLMQKFLREASPETKKRMKEMSISEFKAMYNAIMDEEGEGTAKAASRRVLARYIEKQGMEHATPEALQEYLKEHPGADKALHSVKKEEKGEAKAEGEKPAGKAHALDSLPNLEDNEAIKKARNPKASKDDLNAAREAIGEATEKLYEAGETDDDDPKMKKLVAAEEHLAERFNEAVQKDPDYAKTKTKDYYPQKAPKGMELPKEVSSLGETMEKYIRSMPDKDLDKEEAYDHPKVKAVRNKMIKALKSGELTVEQFQKDHEAVQNLQYAMGDKYRKAESDKEADPYRFLMRKTYQTVRSFRDVMYNFDFDKMKAKKK